MGEVEVIPEVKSTVMESPVMGETKTVEVVKKSKKKKDKEPKKESKKKKDKEKKSSKSKTKKRDSKVSKDVSKIVDEALLEVAKDDLTDSPKPRKEKKSSKSKSKSKKSKKKKSNPEDLQRLDWLRNRKEVTANDDSITEPESEVSQELENEDPAQRAEASQRKIEARRKELMAETEAKIKAREDELRKEQEDEEARSEELQAKLSSQSNAMTEWAANSSKKLDQIAHDKERRESDFETALEAKKSSRELSKQARLEDQERKSQEAVAAAKVRIEKHAEEKQAAMAKKLADQEYHARKEDAQYEHAYATYSIEMAQQAAAEQERLDQINSDKKQQEKDAKDALKAQEAAQDLEQWKEQEALNQARANIESRKSQLEEAAITKAQAERFAKAANDDANDVAAMTQWEAQETQRLQELANWNAQEEKRLEQISLEKKRHENEAKDALKAQQAAEDLEEYKQHEAMIAARARIEQRKSELEAKAAGTVQSSDQEASKADDEAMAKWSAEEDQRLQEWADWTAQEEENLNKIALYKKQCDSAAKEAIQAQEAAKVMEEFQQQQAMLAAKARIEARKAQLEEQIEDRIKAKQEQQAAEEDVEYEKAMEEWSAQEDERLQALMKWNAEEEEKLNQIALNKKKRDSFVQETIRAQELAEEKKAFEEKQRMLAAQAKIESCKQELEDQMEDQIEEKIKVKQQEQASEDEYDKAMAEWSAQEDKRLQALKKWNTEEEEKLNQIALDKKKCDSAMQEAIKAQELAEEAKAFEEKQKMLASQANIESRKKELEEQILTNPAA